MSYSFTPAHRGGSGEPLVCLHGITDTWRTWELVLPELERHHDVLAPTLVGHAGGPALTGEVHEHVIVEGVERAMDEAGFETAHIVGNSLGGLTALQLAARGRARSVVALAPAGGWAIGDDSYKETLGLFVTLRDQLRLGADHIDQLVSTPEGRRLATQLIVEHYEHIPAELIAHQIYGVLECTALDDLVAYASGAGFSLEAERIECPVRVVWGIEDRILHWPRAAARFREYWLPRAEWIELDGVGHLVQLDVPAETAQLILGFISR